MVTAIAVVGTGSTGSPVSIGGEGSSGNYNINFTGGISSDGVTETAFSGVALVSISTAPKKADQLIRTAMAAAALSASGLTIDPDDIYIPFS
jgi:hypothetical protein